MPSAAMNSTMKMLCSRPERLLNSRGAGYTHLLPSPDLDTVYLRTVQSIPVTLFVDESGNILDTHVGARSEKQWRALIDGALAKLG